ncbi:DnaB-like helicase C-terminal domain-containing protein, partial [Salmonella enterica]|uniref:DnaB-like helicase C-terminal domain-containing protein n=1 Tax=Salmonella enterica TaxID=28901 RepID=UPI00398C7126
RVMGTEFGRPVSETSPLHRQVEQLEEKRPNHREMRASGGIEQASDLIMFIYRDAVYNPGTMTPAVAEIIIGKQRQGPTGTVKEQFDGRYTLSSEYQEGGYHLGYPRTGGRV